MSVKTRTMLAGFAVSAVALVWVQSFVGLLGLSQVNKEVHASALTTSAMHLSMDADMMHEGIEADVFRAMLYANAGQAQDLQEARKVLLENIERLHKDLESMRALDLPPEMHEVSQAALPVARAYTDEAMAMVDLAAQDSRQAQERIAQFMKRFDALEHALGAQSQNLNQLAASAKTRSEETVDSAQQHVLLVSVLVTLGVALGCTWFSRFLWRTLGGEPSEAVKAAQTIASGDLSRAPQVSSGHAKSVLGEMSAMTVQLRQLVDEVRGQAEAVSSASSQIAQGNVDLSQRTEAQASSLQQTTVSMQQLGGILQQTTADARTATTVARQACTVAHQGGEAMNGMVATMQGISDSAHRIADITSVIDGIAFQTNILALNAAVEAARAGEQGKGFAVVASEVRSLAQRSSQAAREIKQLINDSVERVATGAQQVEHAQGTMQDILSSIGQVSELVDHIMRASDQQTQGLSEAARAVMQMDSTTQQNATLVEETAAAAESLRSQASRLVDVVARFKLAA
jgi:methyl-accepting chemotaxis protein